MEGMGIYIWNDGRKYEGQYKDDKKHGFGVYTWADERCYEGYWYKGKQHGLGKYVVPKDDKTKYGLWEDGKRIEWFNEDQISRINNYSEDYTKFFNQSDSKQMVDSHSCFRKPANFDSQLDVVKKRNEELAIRAGKFELTEEQMHGHDTPEQYN